MSQHETREDDAKDGDQAGGGTTGNAGGEGGGKGYDISGEGPGARYVSRTGIIWMLLYMVVTTLLLLYTLVVLWPHPAPAHPQGDKDSTGVANGGRKADPAAKPRWSGDSTMWGTDTPLARSGDPADTSTVADRAKQGGQTSGQGKSGTANPQDPTTPVTLARRDTLSEDPVTINYFGYDLTIWNDVRLLLIVIVCGALGSLIHSIRSIFWYIGNRKLVVSWLPMYYLLPCSGAILAVIFYLVIRGGFFSPESSYRATSPFSFAALAALVGMFSQQAVL